jgi:hypothetical protein
VKDPIYCPTKKVDLFFCRGGHLELISLDVVKKCVYSAPSIYSTRNRVGCPPLFIVVARWLSAAFAVSQDATPSTWGPWGGEPAKKKYQDHVICSTSFVKLQTDRRCCAVSGWFRHRGQIGLCCISLVARLSVVSIFSCIAVHAKNLTFGSMLAFHNLSC